MKLTAPVKLVRLMAMTELAVEPRVTEVALPGPTVKSPVPVTVSDTEVVRDNVPEVAVNVTVAGPRVAVLDALNVAVTELPVVAVAGLSTTVTPLGRPLTVDADRAGEVAAGDGDRGAGGAAARQ